MKKLLLILPLLFWLGCGGDYESGDTGWRHPFVGTWKVTDYCVYESANCDSNCNNQEFLPIFYQGYWGFTYMINNIDGEVITIDEDGDGVGFSAGINFSHSQQNFTVGADGYSWSPFPGITNYMNGYTIFSGTCILNDDNNTLDLIYYAAAECIVSTSEDWDGSGSLTNEDSIECYNYHIVNNNYGFNDTTYYYETWYPEYCAKITLTK